MKAPSSAGDGMRHTVLLGLLVAMGLARGAWAQDPITAFVNVSVVPMDRERVLPHQTVIVRGARIVALGPAHRVRVPPTAVRIDGKGKFLLPGLADMHTHIPGLDSAGWFPDSAMADAERQLFLFVANGVTTIRVMRGWAQTLTLRDRVARGELFGPRMYVARRAIEHAGKGWEDSAVRIVEDVEAAKAAGYDLYKVHGAIKGGTAAHDSLVAAARRVRLPIAGHVPNGVDNLTYAGSPGALSLEQAIDAGYTSIEHLLGFAEAAVPGYAESEARQQSPPEPGLDQVDEGKLHAIALRLRQARVWNCVTLGVRVNVGRSLPIAQHPELRYLPDSARQFWAKRLPYFVEHDDPKWFTFDRKVIRALRETGAGILLGTDSPISAWGMPLAGFPVHEELLALVRAGLTPYQALATGTRNVAAYLGTLDSTGTVAVGKRADLVLLAGNPLTDIRQTAVPAGVMVGGHWLDRTALDARLPTVVASLINVHAMVRLQR